MRVYLVRNRETGLFFRRYQTGHRTGLPFEQMFGEMEKARIFTAKQAAITAVSHWIQEQYPRLPWRQVRQIQEANYEILPCTVEVPDA